MAIGKKRAPEQEASSSIRKTPKTKVTSQRIAPTKSQAQESGAKDQLTRIAECNRSPFEKRVWTALCHIPRGSVTTYSLLSAHLGSSPRAVGNALRRNPFAPDVPCHRVVATGMTLGGFKGKWPRNGEGITLDEKRRLLRGEGIRFDDKGKVLGTPWVGWTCTDPA
ncbi:hypothetical protein HIM_08568 [Hirsutella minnesotensis 3608]|uniref:Methylated-DNA--protein-cysteine methyltransferase n=1 Tax=Hirsutella minnesotensis 3608 TaxID=1043627 RepID=A0A0F7ZY80_9HYPO|nr:hypothetical protein HIM_08568 [Hirsutella minnesotensis 3608]